MTAVDIGILTVIAISAIIGLVRGLVREVLSLVVWLGACVVALGFAGEVANRLEAYFTDAAARFAAAFALLFLGTLIAGAILQWGIGKLITSSGLSGMDRVLGFGFGGARGAVLVIVAMVMLRPFSGSETWWHASTMINALEPYESRVLQLFDTTAATVRDLTAARSN